MKKIILLIFLIMSIIGIGSYFYISHDTEEVSLVSRPIVTVDLSNNTSFKMQLDPEAAPNTVCNFIDLARCGFYNGLGFSKILPNYFVQTGDTIGNGTGYPGYFIKSECKDNGYPNKLKCLQGTVCMARSDKFNTEGSQFFVLLKDAPELDGRYTAFGTVIEGLEHLMALTEQNEVTITSMEVETFNVAYKEPKVLAMTQVRDTP
nr:peptidylprolyl isomerase [uncultured Cellulosilyticum sp.]